MLDWYGAAAPAATLLLDQYPNAAAAYSLRLLNSAYTGNCIEVRRSNDNALQNIGFLGGYVDTSAIVTFCSGTNCFVRTWYDQSGNARNLVQTTAANQPNIFTSGAIQQLGGKKALKGDGDDNMTSAFSRVQPHSLFYVGTIVLDDIAVDGSSNNLASFYNSSSSTRIGARTFGSFVGYTIAHNPANHSLISALWNGASSRLDANLVSGNGSVGTDSTNGLTIFAAGNLGNANLGFTQEVILYNSNNTSDWSGIQSNINAFYTIY